MKKIALLFTLFFTLLCRHSFAANEDSFVSSNDIMKEVEKALLFNNEDKQKINFYYGKKTQEKNSLKIDHSTAENEEDDKDSKVKILVFEPKTSGLEIKEKEKLAYNANITGQYEVAIELYKQILNADPDNNYAKFSLATTYQNIGQLRQAKTNYYELLKNNPTNRDEIISNLLAITVEQSPRDAVFILSRLGMQNPKSSYIAAQTAMAYEKLSDYNKAISLLEKAVNLDQNRLDYKYNLAILYDKNSLFDKALATYEEVERIATISDQDFQVPVEQVKKRINYIKQNKS